MLPSIQFHLLTKNKVSKTDFKVWSPESSFLCICDLSGDFSTLIAKIEHLNFIKGAKPSLPLMISSCKLDR